MIRKIPLCRFTLMSVLLCMIAVPASATLDTVKLATFSDPSVGSATPLFTVDLQDPDPANHVVHGGWDDSKTGLTLEVSITGNEYPNAFFTLSDLDYTGTLFGGVTGPGSLRFYADGKVPGVDQPLLQYDFNSATVNLSGLGGDDVFSGNGITITGTELIGTPYENITLEQEVFNFSFANLKAIVPSSPLKGYTATAAFTSSVVVPEPVTGVLLGLAGTAILRRRRR